MEARPQFFCYRIPCKPLRGRSHFVSQIVQQSFLQLFVISRQIPLFSKGIGVAPVLKRFSKCFFKSIFRMFQSGMRFLKIEIPTSQKNPATGNKFKTIKPSIDEKALRKI